MIGVKKITMVAAMSLVAACSYRLEDVRTMTPETGAFQQALHEGYVGLADGEFAEYDNPDGCKFTDRAEALSKGGDVLPEEISARNLPANKVNLMTSVRKRLMRALDNGARDSHPVDAARAQVAFDCWMQEQEENKQPEDIAKCQADFIAAMEKIEAKPKPAAAAPAPAPAPAPAAAMLHDKSVFFGFDSAELDDKAYATIAEAVDVIRNENVSSVELQAYADRSGAADYNQRLAQRRADAVMAALLTHGLDAGMVKTVVNGESNLLVPTADGVKEARNRRVEFLFTR